MRVFWKFLQGMVRPPPFSPTFPFPSLTPLPLNHQLTNLGPQPVTRMHTTLNTLVETYKGHTVEELTSLLEVMQAEGLVEKSGNNWKIVK